MSPSTTETTSRRPAPVAATSATVLSFALVAATAVVMGLSADSPQVLDYLYFCVPLSWTVVGAVIATQRPDNSIGWWCLSIGLLWAAQALGFEGAEWAAGSGEPAAASWIGLLSSWWLPGLGLMGTHLLLRLPSGSLLSARWRWWSRFSTLAIAIAMALVLVAPGPVAEVSGTSNPLGLAGQDALSPLLLLLPIAVGGSAASLVLRYRRAGVVERVQIRWIAYAGGIVLAGVVLAFVPTELGLAEENSAPAFVEGLLYVAFTTVPVAIGISVLRYRLYDIDVVINRTLVYGSLTAILAAAYVGTVLMLQLALGGITQDSQLAVAGSTLAAAALFRPARARIQTTVDRRFYRRRYDAGRTLEAFATRLRQQVDLAELTADLRGVVTETMQPTSASLWLPPADQDRRLGPGR